MSKKPLSRSAFEARFPTEEACMDHLMRVRYGERFNCPQCDREARYYRIKDRRAFTCEHCGNQVYPTAGTPFDKTRTPLKDWFFVMFLFCTSRNGVASKEVERQLGVTYKTAWRMCYLIRKYMGYVDGDMPLGGPGGSGVIETDKAFIGGKDKMAHQDKAIVLGMVERGGDIITRHIHNRSSDAVVPHIVHWVRPGSRVFTDSARTFADLRREGFQHESVNHDIKEWVRGDVHTNTIEAFWANLKRGINGTYIHVSKKHLQVYLGEFEFRHNLRKRPDLMLEALLLAFPRPHAPSH